MHLSISQNTVTSCESVIFLGVILNQQLKPHIDKITKQVSKAMGIIWKIRNIFPEINDVISFSCISTVEPYLLYGIAVWGSTVLCGAQNR